jgi:hypothetical protein
MQTRSKMTKKELLSKTNIFKEAQDHSGHFVWWAELPRGWVFKSGAHIEAGETKAEVVDAVRYDCGPCECSECKEMVA